MPILGMRTDENFITNQRPQNWRQTILMLYPNSAEISKAPLTALTSMMKEEKTDDPVFHWFQKNLDARRLKINEDLDTSETAVDIDATYQSAFILKAGDMLWIEGSGEIVRVASDPAANNLITVSRAQAGTSGTALAATTTANPYATVIGSAFEEGSLAPTGVNYDPVEAYNYTQIFRSALEMTRTAAQTRLRTGDQIKEAKRECLEYFTIDMERAFWFNGSRTLVTINGKPARMTAGLINQIVAGAPGNIYPAPAGGLINMDWMDAFMQAVFAFGSTEKVMFGSNVVLGAINTAVRKGGIYNIENVKEYGMKVSRITGPFGTLVFKAHPLFNQTRGGLAADGVTTYTTIANNAYVLDMQFIRYRYMMDVTYQPDLTPIGLDGEKSGYIAECGLELNQPTAHWIATGITGGDVDG